MNGSVTDIQRFSLHDGDGIRTTVFLKGCNMKCEWCHNPETINFKNDILFYETNCIGCGKCFDICPVGAHSVIDGKHTIDKDKCTLCGKCVDICAAQALKFSSKQMSIEEIMSELVQDKAYYEASGGGVTVSGGEALCQLEFTDMIATACRENNIKVAVETNLFHKFDAIKDTLNKFDLIMFDIKIFDDEIHKQHTGVSNKLILENAKKVDELGIPFIVRTPLIPGVTDSDENLLKIAELVSGFKNMKYYELLNFNPLGSVKYVALDTSNPYRDSRPLGNERIDEIKSLLGAYNVKIS